MNLDAFTTGDDGKFVFDNTQALKVAGEIDATGIALTTTGAGSNIAIDAALDADGGVVALNSGGNIMEDATLGSIQGYALTGSSNGGVVLDGSNSLSNLKDFTTNGMGDFSLTNTLAITVTGEIDADSITLTTTGAGSNIVIGGTLDATGLVTLDSEGAITENSGAGVIDANSLTGSSAGSAILDGENAVGDLAGFTAGTTGNFSLVDEGAMKVTGAVDANNITLDNYTGSATFNIDIEAELDAANDLTLDADGSVGESGAGQVVTDKLFVMASTGILLTSLDNDIRKVMENSTTSGSDIIDGVQ